jgi:FkbM family methyltransferase
MSMMFWPLRDENHGTAPMDLTLAQYEELNPRCEIAHNGTRMVFATPTTGTKWRVDTIHQKEPCTLEWIAAFDAADVLVDVGANVGMYTIWAAATRGTRVFAFEPESANYALLNRNIFINNLQDRVSAYCMGLSDAAGLTALHMGLVGVGQSCHSVGEALDYKHDPMAAAFRQGCIVSRLDDLVSTGAIPMPNHIKIDVDGFEPKVIAGARSTLKNAAVRSVLVELNLNLADHAAIVEDMKDLGFWCSRDQVKRAMRQDGAFKGLAEHVFKR